MKKSRSIQLTLLNSVVIGAATACSNHQPVVDPCNTHTFNAPACQVAIQQHGYYYGGSFIPLVYAFPFLYYRSNANSYLAGGGQVYPAPMSSYSRTYVPLNTRAENIATLNASQSGTVLSSSRMSAFSASRSGGVASRGGFGSIGSSHGTAGE